MSFKLTTELITEIAEEVLREEKLLKQISKLCDEVIEDEEQYKEECADCDRTLDTNCPIMCWTHREEEKTFCRECWEDKHWRTDDNEDNQEEIDELIGYEAEKRLKKVKRITKKLKQDSIERFLAEKGKRLTNLRRHKDTTLDEIIKEHNIDIKHYQKLFMSEKIKQENRDKHTELHTAKQEKIWKEKKQLKQDYLGKYSIPYDMMANKYVLVRHLTKFVKEKDPEYVKRNELLKRRKEIAEMMYRERCGVSKMVEVHVETGYEEEMTEEHIETLYKIGRSEGYKFDHQDFFYMLGLGYYLD